jgi:hypothetical protein
MWGIQERESRAEGNSQNQGRRALQLPGGLESSISSKRLQLSRNDLSKKTKKYLIKFILQPGIICIEIY